jgi:hypothetical protein
MTEKEFEHILIKHPELIEEGLIFLGNQVSLDGKQLDLLFKDKNGQKLIIEVKLIARRKDIAQLIDYAGYFIGTEAMPIRTMIVAFKIPKNYQNSFDYFGFEYKEILEHEFLKVEPLIDEKEIFQQIASISDEMPSIYIKPQADKSIKGPQVYQNERNLTRQNMASRIKGGRIFNQARYAIDFLKKSSMPISMKEFVDYMKARNFKSKSYYDLFNSLCDSGLVKSTVRNGCKCYQLADD